jgi:hypothetical protein
MLGDEFVGSDREVAKPDPGGVVKGVSRSAEQGPFRLPAVWALEERQARSISLPSSFLSRHRAILPLPAAAGR